MDQKGKHRLNETEDYNSKYIIVYDKDIIHIISKTKCAMYMF